MNKKLNLVKVENVGICFKRRRKLLKSKLKKEFWALKDVSFEINKGENLGVIGKNGAGKSTILSILSGIYAPDKGRIIKDEQCKISLLSLQAGFVPYLSGRKNIYINGLLLGMEKSFIQNNLNSIIEFSELGEFIDEPVETYSAGMKARLGFSTALYMEPDIVLIDEVLGVGDQSFREKSSAAIKAKLNDNMTALIVSHNPNTIKNLCDKAIWIDKGIVRASGSPDEVLELYSKPS